MIDMETQRITTDVQMINVAAQSDMHDMADYPYGMAVAVGYLRDQGIDTLFLQYPTWKKEEYLEQILDNPAYLYGFQVNFDNYPDIRDLAKIIKENNPQGKIVFGGPFVVSLYEELLKNDPNLDAVVLGEGEYTVVELILKLKEGDPDWKQIQGLAWLDDQGEVVMNPHRPAIQNMNEIRGQRRNTGWGIRFRRKIHSGCADNDLTRLHVELFLLRSQRQLQVAKGQAMAGTQPHGRC